MMVTRFVPDRFLGFDRPVRRRLLLTGFMLFAAACLFPSARAAAPPSTDGSYAITRVEPVSSGGATTFRHTLTTRRPTIQFS